MNFQLDFSEARRLFGGLRAFQEFITTADDVSVGLAVISTRDLAAHVGVNSRYEIVVASTERQPLWINLRIEVVRQDTLKQNETVWFSRRVFVRARSQVQVFVDWDWRSPPEFEMDGVRFVAETSAMAIPMALGVWRLRAVVLDERGKLLGELSLHQQLHAERF